MIENSRRAFLTGLLAAPLVVKSTSLMALRGIVMPVRGFIWGKRTEVGGDPALGLIVEEAVGFPVAYEQANGSFEPVPEIEAQILDNMRALVAAHRDGEEFLAHSQMDFPLGFKRFTPEGWRGPTYSGYQEDGK